MYNAVDMSYLHGHLLSCCDHIVQDRNDVALVACNSAPEALNFVGVGGAMPCSDAVHAVQQPFAPSACTCKRSRLKLYHADAQIQYLQKDVVCVQKHQMTLTVKRMCPRTWVQDAQPKR